MWWTTKPSAGPPLSTTEWDNLVERLEMPPKVYGMRTDEQAAAESTKFMIEPPEYFDQGVTTPSMISFCCMCLEAIYSMSARNPPRYKWLVLTTCSFQYLSKDLVVFLHVCQSPITSYKSRHIGHCFFTQISTYLAIHSSGEEARWNADNGNHFLHVIRDWMLCPWRYIYWS